MVEIKHCRSVLMNMFHAGYVSLQEIPKTADHKPMTTIYAFYVNLEQAFNQVAIDTYKMLLNLRLRAKFQQDQERDLLQTVQIQGGIKMLNDKQKQRLLIVNKKLQTLEAAIVKFEQVAALFNDF
eukprot:TRINITY_DN4815_c0_g4_i1.p2 TRINITY_DN4815_c0_g4~~TRINITY_DN4815_c0_g4_i1.p2  ORF type:complete len:125 (-),score=6.33 TRINITY_DN4815_c0_g4_i1:180-554(-)